MLILSDGLLINSPSIHQSGVPHGYGRYVFASKAVYEGDWVRGKRYAHNTPPLEGGRVKWVVYLSHNRDTIGI